MNIGPEDKTSRVFGRAPLAGLAIMVIIMAGLVVDADKNNDADFYFNINRLNNVTTKIRQNYVEEINAKDIVDKAVEGMLQILDPHTTYFEKKQYEELRIHTEGKFGGLGIQISIRDNVLTVMTPITGTPASRAGIQSGDQIIKIDGKSTKGMSIDKAVSILRGEPGTEITISIRRKGEAKDNDYTLTREIIRIKSVPYAGIVGNNIGYVQLTTFSEVAGQELEKAIKELSSKGIKGLVFDLRSNPGGLLPQAIEVSEKFLSKGKLVVSTRGRLRGQNKEENSNSNPVLSPETPLVVLVDNASASASEIVAGAIQDWDRGIILGDTTFGKGSVQSILPLDETHHLKLTTAFYYTPSGRCINKPENGIRGGKKDDDIVGEDSSAIIDSSDRKPDSSSVKPKVDTTIYRTRNGRIVQGGGGIVPDTIVKEKWPPLLVRELIAKDLFFKFANLEYPKLKQRKITITKGYIPDAVVMKDFHAFVDSSKFKFTTLAHMKFDEFKTHAGLVDTAAERRKADSLKLDSAKTRKTEKDKSAAAQAVLRKALDEDLGLKLTGSERTALEKVVSQIDELLTGIGIRNLKEQDSAVVDRVAEALLVREFGQDNELLFRYRLDQDQQLKEALSIIADKKAYQRLLTGNSKKQ